MAAIPAYLIVGDYRGLCGTQGTNLLPSPGATAGSGVGGLGTLGYTGAISFWSFGANLPWLMRTVPITFSGEPDYAPWWDGAADSGAGAFRKYHHIPASEFVVPFVADMAGDNWFSGIKTFGWTAGFMEAMGRKHRNNPAEGFKCLKFGYSGGRASLWAGAGNAAYDALDTELDAMEAAMGSDTLDWKAIVVDWSISDIENNTGTNYYVNALTAIAAIRARIGDTTNAVPVFIVNHDRRILNTSKTITPTGFPDAIATAEYTRILHGALAALANGNIHLVDRQSTDDLANNDFGTAAAFEPDDPIWYSPYSHLEFGRETLPAAIYAVETATTVTDPISGIPTIIMIGDSQCAGSTNPITAVYNGMTGALDNAYIWNANTEQVEEYDPTTNALTAPSLSLLYYGTEYGAMKRALQTWDDVLFVKFGIAGANLTTEAAAGQAALGIAASGRRTYDTDGNDLWPELIAELNAAFTATVRDLQRVPDVRGVVVFLGDNDSTSTSGATAFASHITDWVASLRSICTTRTSGSSLPVVWVVPPTHADEGGQSTLGLAAAKETVRSAITSLVANDSYVYTVDGDSYDLRNDDHIHYSGADIDEVGAAYVQQIIDPSDEGETASGLSGTAAFTVETGSGATDSNSYSTVAFADEFLAERGNPAEWSSATTLAKEDALRQATAAADARYGLVYAGYKATAEQALLWPRESAVAPSGEYFEDDEIPTALKQGVAMLALLHLQGESINPTTRTSGDIASESKAVGGLSKSVTYMGGKSAETQFPQVDRILRTGGVIDGGGSGWGGSYA